MKNTIKSLMRGALPATTILAASPIFAATERNYETEQEKELKRLREQWQQEQQHRERLHSINRTEENIAAEKSIEEKARIQRLEERNMLLNTALLMKGMGLYSQALVSLEMALAIPNPEHPEQTNIINYHIADCYYFNQDVVQAYAKFKALRYKSLPYSFNVEEKIAACSKGIKKRANDLLLQANAAAEDNNTLGASMHLTEAKELFDTINEPLPKTYRDIETEISWFTMRNTINKIADELLNMTIDVNDIDLYVSQVKKCLDKYQEHANFLNPKELKRELELKIKLVPALAMQQIEHARRQREADRKNNVYRQQTINNLLPQIRAQIEKGNLSQAFRDLQQIHGLASAINYPEDVVAAGLTYTPTTQFNSSLEILGKEAEQYQISALKGAEKAAKCILDTAKLNFAGTLNIEFLPKDQQDIQEAIKQSLQTNWYKFEQNGIPDNLLNDLATLVKNQLYYSSMLSRWWNWTNASVYVKDKSALTVSLEQLLTNAPSQRYEAKHIQLPIFSNCFDQPSANVAIRLG